MEHVKFILSLLSIFVLVFLIWSSLMITYKKLNKHTAYNLSIFSGVLLFGLGSSLLFVNYIYQEGANNIFNCVVTFLVICVPGFMELKARSKRRFDNWDNPLYKERFFSVN